MKQQERQRTVDQPTSPLKSGVPNRILDSAEGLFAQHGYQSCSIRRIAKAAGTSESGVLRFFESKEDIFLAVIERALDVLLNSIDRAAQALPSDADAVVRLLTLADVVFVLFEEEPEKVALVFSEGGLSIRMLRGSEGRSLMSLPGMTALVERVTDLFKRGTREGAFKRVDPVAAREVFFGVLEGTILGWLLASEPSGQYKAAPAKKVLAILERMLRGLS